MVVRSSAATPKEQHSPVIGAAMRTQNVKFGRHRAEDKRACSTGIDLRYWPTRTPAPPLFVTAGICAFAMSIVTAFPGLYLMNQDWGLFPISTRYYLGSFPDPSENVDDIRASFASATVCAVVAGLLFILASITSSVRSKKREAAGSESGNREDCQAESTNPYESPNTSSEFVAPQGPERIVRPLATTMLGTIALTAITFVFAWLTGYGFVGGGGYSIFADELLLGAFCGLVGMFPVILITFFAFKYRDRGAVAWIAASVWAMVSAAGYYYLLTSFF
jgi:hypothetical protein